MSTYRGITHSNLKAINLEADRVFVPEVVLSKRARFTVAEINAGATLVAAIPGRKIRMTACKAIAIGGAVGAVTTVDVLATQAASSVKLVAYTQAGLTQNTVVRDANAAGPVLAGGASYIANDTNTAITVGKTGSNITTATHIDILFDYVVEP